MSSASDTLVVLPPSDERLRHDVVVRIFVVAWLAVVSPYLGLLFGRSPSLEFRNVWTFVLLAAFVAAACLADGRRTPRGAERRFRALVAAAFLVWAGSELGEHLLSRAAASARLTLRDAAFAVFGVLMCAAGLVESDRGIHPAAGRLRRLHRAEVALFAGGLFVYLAVLPARLDPALAASAVPSALYFVTIDVLMLGLFAWRQSRARSAAGRARFTSLIVAAALFLFSDALFLAATLGVVVLDTYPALDLLWYLPHLAVVAAVRRSVPADGGSAEGFDRKRAAAPRLRIAPGFLYAALVPVVHLGAELVGALSTRGARLQHLFALLVTLVLFGLAWVHQRRQRALWESLRRELVAGSRRRAAAVKLEAIGRLAAGVAHDFNNLLTVVVGRADLMHSRLDSPAARREVEAVLDVSHRATALTAELLAVGEREASSREAVEVDAHLAGRYGRDAARAGSSVELAHELGAAGRRIEIDRSHLDRILDNLISNAVDAMPRGGRLTIATRRQRLQDGWTRQLDEVVAGDYLTIEVRDEGVGMEADVLERIFEPFFTTKDLGRGVGLGLATVRGLVRQNGGQIVAHSRPGQGTLFELHFPERG